jgi:selenocysteine lyase/cysteine desulfurase
MRTNNEAFEIWYECRFGKEGLKTALNHPYLSDGEYVYESTKDKLFTWQAATAEANQRMAELEERYETNTAILHGRTHRMNELQAYINTLREALEVCKYDCNTGEVIGIAREALKEVK